MTQQYPYPQSHHIATPPPMNNGLGTAALVLGILGAIFSVVPISGVIAWPMVILGLVFGIVGFVRAKNGKANNQGVALSGAILSGIGLILCIAWTAVFAEAASNPSTVAPVTAPNASTTSTAPTAESANELQDAPEPVEAGIGDGTHIIGKDMERGTYRSTGAKQGLFEFCSWSTLSGASSNSDILDFGTANANEPMVVEIEKNAKAFKSSNCEPWIKQ